MEFFSLARPELYPFNYQGSGRGKSERANSQKIEASVPDHTVAADCDEWRQIPAVFDQREGLRQPTTIHDSTDKPASAHRQRRLGSGDIKEPSDAVLFFPAKGARGQQLTP